MAYIGKSPAEQGQPTSEQEITASANQTDFTLAQTVSRETDILVSINGVVQPASAYSISGLVLTMSGGLTLNDVLRVHYIGYKPTYFGLQPASIDIAHLSATGTPTSSLALKGNNTWGTAGNPSLGTDAIIRTNGKTIVANITFAGTENGMSAGPITIADTKTVTVTDGSTWTVF
jgi:hypothetical protein